jgi:hypothetical protein
MDKSIVSVDGGPRFRTLETIREFGLTKLRDSGEETVLRDRHRSWYEHLLRQAQAEWLSSWQEYWLARLNSEHANISAALQYCLTEPRLADEALRLAIRPWRFYWWSPGRVGEGRRWLDQAIAHATEHSANYAKAVLLDSQLTAVQGTSAPRDRCWKKAVASRNGWTTRRPRLAPNTLAAISPCGATATSQRLSSTSIERGQPRYGSQTSTNAWKASWHW